MSAYITSHEHTLVLAQAIARIERHETTQSVYNKLSRENYRSVNFRYREKARMPKTLLTEAECCGYPKLTPVQIYKLAQCQAYQSCEHPGWERSKARQCLNELMVQTSYDVLEGTKAYEDVKWSL